MYYHRWLIEQHLNRKLLSSEVVHHIDKDRLNNEIKNLQLFKNNSAHIHLEHKPQGHICKVLNCNRPTCQGGYCAGHYKRFYRYGRVFTDIPLSKKYGNKSLLKIEFQK